MFSESVKDESYGFTTDNTWYNLDNFNPPSNCEEIIIYLKLSTGHRLTMRAMKFELDGLPNGGALFYSGCFTSGASDNLGAYLLKSAQGFKPYIFINGANTSASCKMKLYYRYN